MMMVKIGRVVAENDHEQTNMHTHWQYTQTREKQYSALLCQGRSKNYFIGFEVQQNFSQTFGDRPISLFVLQDDLTAHV